MATEKIKSEIKKMQLDLSQVTRTHSLLNHNQIQKIWNSTPDRFKYNRPAKGGGTWTYIKGSYVRKVLDSVFGFNWTFEVETSLAEAFDVAKMTGSVVVKGTLTGRVKDGGEWIELSKTQFGRADVKWKMTGQAPNRRKVIDEYTGSPIPLDIGNDFKAATTDCMKKCASLFGIGADVYEADEFMAVEIIGSDEAKSSAKATKNKLEKMKREVKVEEVEQ